MTKPEADYNAFLDEVRQEFPGFRLVDKRTSTLMKVTDVALKAITFGKMSSFMDRFTTTVGDSIYVPEGWEHRPVTSRLTTLRHERVHLRQARRLGRFLMSLMYLLVPLPVLFAYYRTKLEQEAYEESLAAIQEYGGNEALLDPDLRVRMIDHFVTAEYFWAWPWRLSVGKWYDAAIERLLAASKPPSK